MKLSTRLWLIATVLGYSLFAQVRIANAEVVMYLDSLSFFVASGATDATGALPDLGAPTNLDSITLGSVTIQAPRFGISDWDPNLPGAEIAISAGAGSAGGGFWNEGIDVFFAAPVFSAGFDFLEPDYDDTNVGLGCNTDCVDSTFEITLLSGATELATFTFLPTDGVASFFGVWSDTAFDGLRIRETIGTNDNEYYGRFYTGSAALVPVPGAVWLFGSALVGMLGFRRRG